MQLELFDIQTDNAGRKGKVGLTSDRAAARQEAGTAGQSRVDFLASLRLVSKKGPAKADDLPVSAVGSELTAKASRFTQLGDVLNEIMRAWPAGRRPAVATGIGGDRNKITPPETTPTKTGSNTAVLQPVQVRQASGLAKQGLDGFTNALIKRLSRARDHFTTTSVAVNTALTQDPMHAASLTQSQSSGKQSRGKGIRVLNLQIAEADSSPPAVSNSKNNIAAQNSPAASNPRMVSADQQLGTDAEKNFDRQTLADVKNDLGARVRQNAEELKTTLIKGEPKTNPQTEPANPGSRVSRPTSDAFTGKTVIAKSAAVNADQPKAMVASNDQKAAAVKVFQFGLENQPAEAAVVKSAAPRPTSTPIPEGIKDTAINIAVPEKSKMTIGKTVAGLAFRSSLERVDIAKIQPAGGSKLNGEDTPILNTMKTDIKTASVREGNAVSKAEFLAGERETLGPDLLNGQSLHDTKSGDQARIEVADAKIKPTEPLTATPKAQPSTGSAAASDPEKSVLDRVSEARVLEQIATRMRLQARNGANEIRIQLRPETLGQMQLKVLAQDQTVSIKILAETAMARDIIDNNIGQLRSDLSAQGLTVEKLDVELQTTSDRSEKDTNGQRGGFTKQGRGTAHHGGQESEAQHKQNRQLHTNEDETDEGTLIGVFA